MKIVGVKTVSEFLGLKESTVYQWAELGQMPYIKLNGSLRFDLDDIVAWVAACKKDVRSEYNPFTQTARGPRKGGKKTDGTL